MAAAFAMGYALGPAPTGGERKAAVDVADLSRSEPFPFSIHAKSYPLAGMPARTRTTEAKKTIETIIANLPREPEAQPPLRDPVPPFRHTPVTQPLTRLVAFQASPFPYNGVVPRTNAPFLNFEEDGRQGHKTFSGRIYWADQTYSDRRVLLHIPQGFDTRRPAVMVVFFHGHGATLERDVLARQRVPAQISESGINAVLVAPQFAVNARDSSAGNFWKPGGAGRFLDEVADKLAEMYGDARAERVFANMPVVIVGYSGGYLPAAWALARGGVGKRVKGVVLLDGLYGEVDKFAGWIERARSGFFLSAYTASTKRGNEALQRILALRNIPYRTQFEPKLGSGSVVFVAADEEHRHYVTRAWADNPISDLLIRMTGAAPRALIAQSAALAPGLAR